LNAKQSAALALVVLLVVVALAASANSLLSVPPAKVTYTEPASAVHTSLGETANDGTIALRLNSINDASDPATSSVWIELNNESNMASGAFYFSLTPPPAKQYLVANVTVTNVHHTNIPFDYGDFVLIAHDGSAYYANYAVCNTGCSAQALKNHALNATFASDLYVLFSVPSTAQPIQIAYTGANPPIVMSST
jgi:hypothetical protein